MHSTDQSERERRLDEIATAYLQEIERGNAPQPAEWLARYPDLADELAAFFAAQEHMAQLAAPLRTPAGDDATTQGLTAVPARGLGTVRYFGDYELLEEIGRGGMGVVYRAMQVSLKRTVALKMILSGQLANADDVRRFHAEAEAAARLDHPGIVPVYEVGQHEGHHYFSMAFIEGESLARKVAEALPPPREAAELTRKVAEAVSYAHVEGVIHRDLKPGNILVDRQGQPRLTDFGLAKRVQGDSSLTATGQVLGTPSYMPPEQANGQGGAVGPLSDVYSLGAVLYCLLTGRPPFQSDNPLDTLLQVIQQEPVAPRQLNARVPRDLETICIKCLSKEPRKRYSSALDLAADLDRFLAGKPIHARRIGPVGRAWRWCRRNPVVAGLSAALVFALVDGLVTSILFGMQARQEAAVSAELTIKAKELAAQQKEAADRATAQERLTRRYLYSAHMNLAHDALRNVNLLRAMELLNQHRPTADHEDLRSFEWRYLWRECNRERKTIPLTTGARSKSGLSNGYGGPAVAEFAVSPNGKWAAIGIMGTSSWLIGEVCLVDLTTGELRKSIVGNLHAGWPYGSDKVYRHLVFSSDSKLLAMVTWDQPLRKEGVPDDLHRPHTPRLTAWDLDTLEVRVVIPLPGFQKDDRIAISPSCAAVGYGEENKLYSTIKVWDLPANKDAVAGPGRTLPPLDKARRGTPKQTGTPAGFTGFLFTPDGRSLAWGEIGIRAMVLTNVANGKHRSLPEWIYFLAFSPDGKYIANAGDTGPVRLYEIATGKDIPFPSDPMGRSRDGFSMSTIQFSLDSRLVAFGRGLSANVWDVQSKQPITRVRWAQGPCLAVGFTADSRTLITVARNNEARLWDIPTQPGAESLTLGKGPRRGGIEHNTIAAMGITADAKTLAVVWSCLPTGLDSRVVVLYDLSPGAQGKPLGELPANTPRGFVPDQVNFSPDGKWLALGGMGIHLDITHDRHAQLWKIAHTRPTVQATLERTIFAPTNDMLNMTSAVFSPDGTKAAYPDCPWSFDKKTGTSTRGADRVQLRDLAGDAAMPLPAVAGGRWFADAEGLVGFHNQAHWQGGWRGAVFSSDGKRLFTAHGWFVRPWAASIVAWDTTDRSVLAVLEAPAALGQAVQALALSPDDSTLASLHGNTIRLWDVSDQTLHEVRSKLKQQADAVRSGRVQAATEPALTPRAVLRGHGDAITAVAFHTDGKTLASASNDGTIKLWDIVTGEVRLTLDAPVTPIIMTVPVLAFTPDGDTLIHGTNSGTLKFWRAAPVQR
jgi:WD40 repeat protein